MHLLFTWVLPQSYHYPRQQVISTQCPLLPTREWFDSIHMHAMVGMYHSHNVQVRVPLVLDLAPAKDTVSQVDQVTNV